MHPRIEAWLAFVDESAEGAERDRLQEHLESCARCRVLVEDARRMRSALQNDRLLAPSPAARDAALRAFHPARSTPPLPDWAQGLRERAARLVFDSHAASGAAFAGARSAGLARRVRFESAGVELDALIEPLGDGRRLTGQVLTLRESARPAASAPWIISVDDRVDGEGRTDESGELVCEIAGGGEIHVRVAVRPGELAVFRIPLADPLR
ncbi:MAG TPA: zf-HC2 domain-containing protein [bacterium]|nr:zf-HC2 domain-containing protein [bacterium]